MSRTKTMWCQLAENGQTRHFGPHPEVVRLYEPKLPVYAVTVTESKPTPDCYWAWWDRERERFLFVYPARSLVSMCFPYGSKAEEDAGRGQVLPVIVSLGELVPPPARR